MIQIQLVAICAFQSYLSPCLTVPGWAKRGVNRSRELYSAVCWRRNCAGREVLVRER